MEKVLIPISELFEKAKVARKKECSCAHAELRNKPPYFGVFTLSRTCNLGCSYCSAEAVGHPTPSMTVETAMKGIHEMLSIADRPICVLFFGGEPLLSYQNIVEIVNQTRAEYPADSVNFMVQTNVTLLRDHHIDFFKAHNFHLGVSIDGTAEIHDKTRPYVKGTGSHADVVKGISLVAESGLSFGCIVVISAINFRHLTDTLELLYELGVRHTAFNFFFQGGRGHKRQGLQLEGEDLSQAMQEVVVWLLEHNSTHPRKDWMIERTTASLVKSLVRMEHSFMCMSSPCGAGIGTVSFNVNGDVYPCDNLMEPSSPHPQWRMGNIHQTSLKQMLIETPIIDDILSRNISTLDDCRTCNIKSYCSGGCAAHAYHAFGTIHHKTPYCSFSKDFVPYLLDLLYEKKIDYHLLSGDAPGAQSPSVVRKPVISDLPVLPEFLL